MKNRTPPRLAQLLLERLLQEETILGDLLEQYSEDIAPTRSPLRAWLWYWRQTVSFVSWNAIQHLGDTYRERHPDVFWTAVVGLVQFFFTVAMPTMLGFSMQGALFALLVVSLATSALVSADFELPWRTH